MPNLSVLAILGAIIIGLSIFIYIDETRIAACKADSMALTAANEEFKKQVETQNQAIAEIKKQQALADAVASQALKQATKDASKINQQITALQNQKAQGDSCAAANKIFNDYIGGK